MMVEHQFYAERFRPLMMDEDLHVNRANAVCMKDEYDAIRSPNITSFY